LIVPVVLLFAFVQPPRSAPAEQGFAADNQTERMFDRLVDVLARETIAKHQWRYPSEQQIHAMRARIADFRTFDRAALDRTRQEAYDLLEYEFSLYESSLRFFFYDEPFGPGGMHVVLPGELCGMGFSKETDVVEYLQACRDIAGRFEAMIAFQREKASRGLLLSGAGMESAARWCESFVDLNEKNPLITTFDERIKPLKLPDELGRYYSEEARAVFYDVIVPAYDTAAEALREMALEYDGGLRGLRELPAGREYADYLLRRMGCNPVGPTVALDLTLLELEGQIEELIARDRALPYRTTPIQKKATAKTLYNRLKEAAAKDFPPLPRGVKVTIAPMEDMEERAAYAGYYLVPGLRNYKNNYIFYNPDMSTDTLYAVMAHEGIPGHLLQITHGRAGDMPDYCKTLGYLGFIEGWAKYAENYAYKYMEGDAAQIDYRRLSRQFDLLLRARLELGVHIEGWDAAGIKAYVKQFFPNYGPQAGTFDEYWENYYQLTALNGLRYAPYALGLLEMEKLKKENAKLSDLEFHTEVLRRGAAPFSLVGKWLAQA